jgi:hypothetical protein
MRFNQEKCVSALVGLLVVLVAVGLVALGYELAKHRYNKPFDTKVERDTVTVIDTIPHYYPQPVEVEKLRTEYRWLTRVETSTDTMHDSVLVAVPITSKHYGGDQYDAWVSGYEPSLDSIKVYQRTEYITETVTKSKPPNKWELDIVGGIDYNIKQQRYTPHAGGELLYKPNRLQVGIRGGVVKADKVEPYVGGVVRFRIY